MATATGWGALPISMSFGDSIKDLVAELNGPVAKAAKKAGGNIEKEIGTAAEKAADRYEKQQWRMEKSKKEHTAAEEAHRLKLKELQAAQTEVENAENNLARAREQGGKKAEDALLKYEKAQIKVEKATIATRKAEEKLEDSVSEVSRATESAEQAFKDLEKAQEDSNKESSKTGGLFDDLSGKAGALGGALKDVVGKVGPLAAGIAGAASIGEVISLGQEAASSIGGLNRELGLTGDEAKVMGDEVGEVLRSGVVGGAEEAAEAVGAIKAQFKDLSDADISEIADNFVGISKTFDLDMAEATQAAGQLMTNGLAGDAEEAADLMTAAMQRMPKAMRDELPELTNEYGTFFSSLGYGGEDMMGMFVNMSDQGAIAMDKMGDALKEAGIRATDLGDTAAVETLEKIGLGAEDIQNRLLAGGDTAKEAFGQMVTAIQEVPDEAERAEAAVALIGTPLEDLNKAELDGFLGALSGGAEAMEGFEGSSQELSDSIANSLQGRIDSLKGTVQDMAGDGFMFAWDTVSKVTGWMSGAWSDFSSTVADSEMVGKIKDTFGDVKDFATGVTDILFRGDFDGMPFGIEEDSPIVDFLFNLRDTALDLKDRLGDIWDGIQDGIGTAAEFLQPFVDWVKDMLGDSFSDLWDSVKNILGALADIGKALAGGTIDLLKGFFDYAKGLWDVLSPFLVPILKVLAGVIGGALLGAIGLIVGAFRVVTGVIKVFTDVVGWIAENVLAPLISKFGEVAGAVYSTIGEALSWLREHWRDIIDGIVDGWNWLWDTVSGAWEAARTAVFVAFVSATGWVREKWDQFTSLLAIGWTWLKDMLVSVWVTIRDVVFAAFTNVINGVKFVFQTVTGAINTAWTWLKDRLLAIWYMIRDTVFYVFNNTVEGLQLIFETVTGAISGAWTWLKDSLHSGWTWIKDNVFGAMESGLDTLQGWFQTGVDGIGRIWDGLKDAAKKPVKFVVDTVWNDGLLKAINAVTGFIGMDPVEPVKLNFATGGVLPGYTPGRDPYTFIEPRTGMHLGLSGGEAILRPEATRALGKDWVNNVNAAARSGGERGVAQRLGHSHFEKGGLIGNFATGGFINLAGALSGVQESHARFVAKFFPDLFALTSASRSEPGSYHDYGAQKATDWQAQDGQFATQMPTPNSKALARAIFQNFPNTAELIHWPMDGWQNINDGAPFDYGAGTNAQHGNHVHWATHSPLSFDGDDIVLNDIPGGGGRDGSFVKRIWDNIVDKIRPFDKGAGGWFADVPGAFLKSAAGKLWDFVSEKVKSAFSFIGGGGDSGQWSDLALTALKKFGYGEEHLPAMLSQIDIESGGNPNAVNNWDENAMRGTPSSGLIQVIEPTYRSMRAKYPEQFEGLPDDRNHPLTNLVAGVAWAQHAYGGPGNIWPTRDGYHEGGLAGVGQGWLKKTAMEPEMVLNPDMTKAFLEWMDNSPESARVMAKELTEAFRGGDWGYGELARYIGEANAKALVDEAWWLGSAADELRTSFAGGDAGYASLARYLGDEVAHALSDEVWWGGAAVGELRSARKGQDAGFAAVSRYIGKTRAVDLLNGVESAGAVFDELNVAFKGGDFGYAELSRYLGDDIARVAVEHAAYIGDLWRGGSGTWSADVSGFGEQARASAEDYAAEQAGGLLSVFGLEGLVPLAQKAGSMAWDAYASNPVEVSRTPSGMAVAARTLGLSAEVSRGSATIVIEAESDDDLIRVSQFKKLASQVDGLAVEVKRKPKAGARMRGGVM